MRLAAGADRHAGERPGLRRSGRCRPGTVRLFRVRLGRPAAAARHHGIILLLGPRLLPNRSGKSIPADLSKHARTLIEHYTLDDGVFQLRVRATSPYLGAMASAVDLSAYPGVALVATQAGDIGGPLKRPTLAEGDVLIVRGEAATVAALAADRHLAFRAEDSAADVTATLFNRRSGLAEIVIPPRSALIGQTVFPGMVTPSGDLVVLAVQRNDQDQGPNETVLAAGDSLLLQGTWQALDERLADPDVLVVDSPELVRRQAVPWVQAPSRRSSSCSPWWCC